MEILLNDIPLEKVSEFESALFDYLDANNSKELETIRDKAWEEFNSDEFKKLKKSWVATTPVS